MHLYIHLLTSLGLAAILFPFVGNHSLWIVVGGFLVDFDHYLYTLVRFKNWSIIFSYEYHDKRHLVDHEPDILHIFHTFEFWIIMVLAAIISFAANATFLFWMFTLTFAGMILHLILDFTDMFIHNKLHMRAVSLIGWLKRKEYF